MQKVTIIYNRAVTWLLASAIMFLAWNSFAAVTVDPSNAFASATDGFNYGGGLGITLLTIAVVLGAIMFGWRLKSGRGK